MLRTNRVRLFLAFLSALALTLPATTAQAQQTVQLKVVNGATGTGAFTYCTAGSGASGSCSVPVTASVSVSGFTPNGSYATPLSASNVSARVALPSGTVVLVSNVGSAGAYVNLGDGTVTATTSDIFIPAGANVGLTVGANVDLAAITAGSDTTTLNIAGGTGLVGGYGGSSTSSTGGAVFGPTATGSASANPPVQIGGTITGAAGANVQGAAVKPASTAAAATDSSLVVQESPNSALYTAITADPCGGAKSFAPVNLTSSGQIITGTSAKKTYICSINITNGGTAQNVALVEGTGSVCATNIFGLAGGTTAATGWQFGANGGETSGGGIGTVAYGSGDANAAAANVCLLLSSTTQVSGTIGYVQQ